MLTFLFWNVNRRERSGLIVRLAREFDVDVLALAELPNLGERLLAELNPNRTRRPYSVIPTASRLRVLSRLRPDLVRAVEETRSYSILRLVLPGTEGVSVAFAHLPSKFLAHETDQRIACERLSAAVRRVEDRLGHRRTVVMGDLNVNPFEEGMVSAHGLHAVGTRAVAGRGSRVVQGQEYEFFYNPMWSLLGDVATGPPGTYFYERSRVVEYFWHMFDQVLLRPQLLPHYRDGDVWVLDRVGGTRIGDTHGRPDPTVGSDHFPILLRLDL